MHNLEYVDPAIRTSAKLWLLNRKCVFSRRLSRERCPTLTVAGLFFSFFFRQTTDFIAYVPLFTDFTLAHMYSSVLGLR